MGEQRFDHLSWRLTGVRSRRQVLKALDGAVVARVAGTRAADAQTCTAHYTPCSSDAQCCSGAVCEYGLCNVDRPSAGITAVSTTFGVAAVAGDRPVKLVR